MASAIAGNEILDAKKWKVIIIAITAIFSD
ncbi:hypothetical protein L326_10010 [Yersinia pestis 113]|nr:hypothetical protein L327_10110 [Yersinia pestis S3]ERP74753.1 hypothetical protein L326_10010 [Yersinia pestis 113]ERP82821.1 hypothetical protein L325_10035 [Yersinia pestis 9]QOW14047.1 hypothetical protein S96127_1742 [Yersinia pestis]